MEPRKAEIEASYDALSEWLRSQPPAVQDVGSTVLGGLNAALLAPHCRPVASLRRMIAESVADLESTKTRADAGG
jgi:hypothetical protein